MADLVLLVDQWGTSELKKFDKVTKEAAPENADFEWAEKMGVIGPMPTFTPADAFANVPKFDSDITPTALEILAAGGDVQKATEEKAKSQRQQVAESRQVLDEALAEVNADSDTGPSATAAGEGETETGNTAGSKKDK